MIKIFLLLSLVSTSHKYLRNGLMKTPVKVKIFYFYDISFNNFSKQTHFHKNVFLRLTKLHFYLEMY